MESLAITDHGALYGAVEFYSEAKEAGVKPILGCELYVAQGSRHSKTSADKSPCHLTVLARNNTGYQNLVYLASQAHLQGFYYKPRVDKELLAQYSEGLIVLSGCPNSEISRLILQGNMLEVDHAIEWYQKTFGMDNFYLEIQRHSNIPELDTLNPALEDISTRLGVPLVATNDSHYILERDSPLQDILICIHTNTNVLDEGRLKMSDDSYFLKSAEEMQALFADLPQAIENTQRIADRCNVELDFSTLHLPEYSVPENLTADEFLHKLCYAGATERFSDPLPREVTDRLVYELDVIKETQYANYFLVVWDIGKYVHEEGILFGVRGSAASSLALYCLGVTDINPLEYELVFERFLNPERKEMPDIDLDFQDDRRDDVINYVVKKYGEDHVAQIITFGTLGARAAIRDVGRALAMPYADVDQVARLVPARVQSLSEALAVSREFSDLYESDDSLRRLIDTAKQLEGTVRHASTHAAGVVISREPLTEYIPLQRPVKGDGATAMTQFSMEPIAKLGLLKMDFLGLANLTTLNKTLGIINRSRQPALDLKNIPLDDTKTLDLLATGETTSLFQLEGSGMRRYIKELKPTSLNEIAAMIALYRPGPMEHIETYINAKYGRTQITYPHEDLQDILEETYGVIVYQDQVLHIARTLAGYSLGEADVVRKAMGKKVPEIMRQEKARFLEGASERGYSAKVAEAVFSLLEPFAGYAFNKAHSVSYALIAYWTAYFKANHPAEYMCSVLNAYVGHTDKMATAINECRRMGIPIRPPDINLSESEFCVEPGANGSVGIRFGLAAVKNVGASAVLPYLEQRLAEGVFSSIEDFCRRIASHAINRRPLESLIKVGALDSLGNRGSLLQGIERILSLVQREAKLQNSGQATMFDLFGDTVPAPLDHLSLPQVSVSSREQLAWEKELLGVYVSENPISSMVYKHPESTKAFLSDIEPEAGKKVILVGQVSAVSYRQTRQGKSFLVASLELLDGGIEVIDWSSLQPNSPSNWAEGEFLWVIGRTQIRNDQLSIVCTEVKPYKLEEERPSGIAPAGESLSTNGHAPPTQAANNNNSLRVIVRLQEGKAPDDDEERLREVVKVLLEFPGEDAFELEVVTAGKIKRLGMPDSYNTSYSSHLEVRLESLLGPGELVRVEKAKHSGV